MQRFLFATGIEGSYPVISGRDGADLRIDEMEKTGHYLRWKDDLRLVHALGIDALRCGPPYYRVHLGPGRYDWDFTDAFFAEVQRLHIKPIVDLCHFGLPDWLGNFQNPEFAHFFAEYAGAFAQRFPWVELYTPINEIYVTAKFSAHEGLWNERLRSDRAFVTAIKHLAKANILATEAILRVQPTARFIQSESSEYFHPCGPEAMQVARHMNEMRFLALDLTYGHDVYARMYEFLLDNGMTREEYHFFLDRSIKPVCIMGNDYYATNEHIVYPDGSTFVCEMFGYYVITQQYYDRYRIPVMHTETNNRDAGNVNRYGLCDLERRVRPVGEAYRDLIHTWKHRISNDFICLR